jgi:predicted DNA-binding protein YlxM (UPF0122 family)
MSVKAMDDRTRRLLLFDFYGDLLTRRQREVYDLYYQQDLSLGEIGEILGVSRAAVHDLLRRTDQGLERYERALSLLTLHIRRKEAAEALLSRLDQAAGEIPEHWLNEFRARISGALLIELPDGTSDGKTADEDGRLGVTPGFKRRDDCGF